MTVPSTEGMSHEYKTTKVKMDKTVWPCVYNEAQQYDKKTDWKSVAIKCFRIQLSIKTAN